MALKPQSPAQRKLIQAAQRAKTHLSSGIPPALFLTDPVRTPDPVSIAQHLPTGWGIVYRHFGADKRFEIAEKLAETARIRELRLLIAADPDLAVLVGAPGVHWPYHMASEAAAWRSTFPLMTVSAHSPAELAVACRHGVDAVIFSTVFASDSATAGQAMGAETFLSLRDSSTRPIYALGGINPDTVESIAPAPFASVSGIAEAYTPKT